MFKQLGVALPTLILLGLAQGLSAGPAQSESASARTRMRVDDIVILNGRVMDPASGLNAVRSVGITNGTIRTISTQSLRGRDTLNARGLVVAPGFIDLHQHAQSPAGYRVEALDGTTTALELEGGTDDVDAWYRERVKGALINYGVSVGHEWLRMRTMGDTSHADATGAARSSAATAGELVSIIAGAKRGLDRGAVAVGTTIEFTPGATPWEVFELFRVAAAYHATVHVHMRALPEPYYFLETEEVIAVSAATGAAAHIVHIQSSGGEDTPRMLDLIRGARARGLDITTEIYPYTASMAPIESAEHEKWESYSDDKFGRFEWPATGERLTRESFGCYHAIGGMLVEFNNTEATVLAAVTDPLPMIASDGILHDSIGHPRVAGTFARVLGHYVRDGKALALMDALRKITIDPSRRLERRVPGMRRKGRIQVGADADIVLFDPARIIDRATYRQPTLPPAGIPYVLVNGVVVVRDGIIQSGVLPGRAVRAPVR
ncbi:MAG: amidohydrolase family protein [Gemmatimonadaceae bacterium]